MKKFLVILMVVAMASFLFVGCLPSVTPEVEEEEEEVPVVTGAIIDIAAIPGVTAPVANVAPDLTVTATDQYTGVTTWSPTVVGTFAAGTVYTATITLTPKTGYTLTGVLANFFTVAGATSDTNTADLGVVTAIFPAAAAVSIVDLPIAVTRPAAGVAPATTVTATIQYTGTVTWSPVVAVGGTFAGDTVYTATITLTPLAGYTLTGVLANALLVNTPATITSDTNDANSGVVTVVFLTTGPTVAWSTVGNRNGVIDTGETLILTFSRSMTPKDVSTVALLNAALLTTGPAPTLTARTHGTTYNVDVTAAWSATNTVLTVTYVTAVAASTDIVAGDTITAITFFSAATVPVALAATTVAWTLPTVASVSSF